MVKYDLLNRQHCDQLCAYNGIGGCSRGDKPCVLSQAEPDYSLAYNSAVSKPIKYIDVNVIENELIPLAKRLSLTHRKQAKGVWMAIRTLEDYIKEADTIVHCNVKTNAEAIAKILDYDVNNEVVPNVCNTKCECATWYEGEGKDECHCSRTWKKCISIGCNIDHKNRNENIVSEDKEVD